MNKTSNSAGSVASGLHHPGPSNATVATTRSNPLTTVKQLTKNVIPKRSQTTASSSSAANSQEPLLQRVRAARHQKQSRAAFIFYRFALNLLFVCLAVGRVFVYYYHLFKNTLLTAAYNPSSTPQLIRNDVTKLEKIPKRLAAIMQFKTEGDLGGGISGLVSDASDVVAWTLSAGISSLTLYDIDGVLKQNAAQFRSVAHTKLSEYYGPQNVPSFVVRVPHSNTFLYSDETTRETAIEIILLSKSDGRETIVDLTKTMADLAAKKEIRGRDIGMKLIDRELTQLVGPEPDLLLCFGGKLNLSGYPPWHIRLTEFYWEEDDQNVSYAVFIRGLKKYATCKMNVGK